MQTWKLWLTYSMLQFLIDTSPKKMEGFEGNPLVAGQLLTPLTRYSNAGKVYAIDNGAYSGFPKKGFKRLLQREKDNREMCLFVSCPDIVGNGRRTLEIWKHRHSFAPGWPLALVLQDGMEDLDIPWEGIDAIFLGGKDPWKDSQAAIDLVKTAKILDVHSHIGRVNTYKRYELFERHGADTCDGSGIAMYDHMLKDIERALAKQKEPTLLSDTEPTLEEIFG